MMKKIVIVCIFTLINMFAYSQNYNDSEKYIPIVLDGEEAYIVVATGEMIQPNSGKVSTTTPVDNVNSSISSNTHKIVKGDTFYSIAKQYDVKMEQLARENGLTLTTPLQIGDLLTIPKNVSTIAPLKTTIHTVAKGDTLYKIAKLYGITVFELKQLNNLSSNNLSVGQVLKLR